MAKVKSPPEFVKRLEKALVDGLKVGGIKAEVESQPVPTTKLHRVYILAPKFRALKPSERQNLVWHIAEKTLTPDEQLRISMILTLAPSEMPGN